MLRALVTFLASPPRRSALLKHVESYADLASLEASMWVSSVKHRAILTALAGVLAVGALLLLGVSIMLSAVLPGGGWSAHAALWLVPAAFALGAAGCGVAAGGTPREEAFAALRRQFHADLQALDAANAQPATDRFERSP